MFLRVENIDAGYGEVQVLWDVSLEVDAGERVALLGANGAGKSTLLQLISGLLRPRRGDIYLRDVPITKLPAKERVKLGICQIPEGRQLFSGMTVRENLMMGAYARPASDRKAIAADLEWILGLFPEVKERQSQLAGTLSGGEQQMCAIGRGLMARPQLVLIDELSLGLAPVVVDRLMQVIREVFQQRQMAMLLVEQDVHIGLELSTRGYCLETGHISMQGTCAYLRSSEHIRRAYLGI